VQDWLYLAYTPFAVAGLLSLPGRPGGRIRTIADGAVASGALWLMALILVIGPDQTDRHLDGAARTATLGYVILPVFLVGVLLSLLSRATAVTRPFLLRTAVGITLLAAPDLLAAITRWHGGTPADWLWGVHQAGLVAILLSTITGRELSGTTEGVAAPATPKTTGQAILPYLPLGAVLVVALFDYLGGEALTRSESPPILLIAAAVMVRHIAALRDHGRLVAELEEGQRAARAEALRDPLTGLANRTAFIDHLAGRLTDPAAHPVAVALLDLNNFKDINDTHGHDTGDLILQRCAERLAAVVPAGGMVARLGGDEFAICQPNAHDGGQGLVDAALAAFDDGVEVGRRRFPLRPSVGAVVDERAAGSADADDAMRLLAHADVAMYQAKAGKNTHTSTGVVLAGAARARAAALTRLRDEVSHPDLTQFHVVYQPVVDLHTGTIGGVEALIRWRHPELGNVSPAEFIPLAEQVGSVNVLGEHVLVTAISDLAAWRAAAPAYHPQLGVNLSPRQLVDPDLPARISTLLAAHGIDAHRLCLEITETALVDDLDSAVDLVAELRAAGMSVAVDDFGTGYSSLRYLRRFAADVVKIDREFVQAVVGEPRTAALVKSVLDMAGALELGTIAEGIETIEQLRAVQQLGCRSGQGYLFSRPVGAEVIDGLLRSHHSYPVGAATEAEIPHQFTHFADLLPTDRMGD
jgi:diguanylate cyclase (GGDEF)-like protein